MYDGNVKIVKKFFSRGEHFVYLFIHILYRSYIQQKHVHILANQLLGYVNTESSLQHLYISHFGNWTDKITIISFVPLSVRLIFLFQVEQRI